jgi:hypothetical protein
VVTGRCFGMQDGVAVIQGTGGATVRFLFFPTDAGRLDRSTGVCLEAVRDAVMRPTQHRYFRKS